MAKPPLILAAFVSHGFSKSGSPASSGQVQEHCSMLATRLLPTPSLQEFDQCMQLKVSSQSAHDWGIPGAEFVALASCWCAHGEGGLTQTIADSGCCTHRSFKNLCSVNCTPDCDSSLAQRCVTDCPPMCLEAHDYYVDRTLCNKCNIDTCFPYIRCITARAAYLTESGQLQRTCHEAEFLRSERLARYWQCWRSAPKHSSHWNVISSVVHCACREGMNKLANETDCCGSLIYGGGVCETTCPSELDCSSQVAQTCIRKCQSLCHSDDPSSSPECAKSCLGQTACRAYLGCRTPQLSAVPYICDDGRWPESSSGCCRSSPGQQPGCPALCATQLLRRVDRPQNIPWWSRWSKNHGAVYQCVCSRCPRATPEAMVEVKRSLEQNIWDNGQAMLIDIARREGLTLGPTRQMQTLAAERNAKVLGVLNSTDRTGVGSKVSVLNKRYSSLITKAARDHLHGGRGDELDHSQGEWQSMTQEEAVVVAVACTAGLLLAIGLATWLAISIRRRTSSPIAPFSQTGEIVIGRTVSPSKQNSLGFKTVAETVPLWTSKA